MAVEFLDSHYIALSAIVTVVFQLVGWAIAVAAKTEVHYDFFGGLNYILLALLTLFFSGTFYCRQIVLTTAVCLSRGELAGFLAFRVCSRKSDARFDEAKKNPCLMLVFWSLQILWVLLCVSPCIYVNGSTHNPDLAAADYIGWAMLAVGFIFEVAADIQKYNFRNDDSNRGKACAAGLWYYSRHPNYFGEILFWWGAFVSGTTVFLEDAPGWFTVVSPVLTMILLLGISGIPLAEGKHLQRFFSTPEKAQAFNEYFERTSH